MSDLQRFPPRVTRRRLCSVGAGSSTIVLAALVALPACTWSPQSAAGRAQQTPAKTREPVTLIHSTWGAANTPWGEYNTHHIGLFKQHSPNVTIDYQSVPSFVEYHTKLLAQVAADTAPDTYAQSNVYYPKYVSIGGALPLEPYVDRTRAFELADFLPSSLRLSTYKGKLYGLPHISSAWVRVWHKNLFGQAGLSSPNDADKQGKWDWDAFLDTARRLTGREADGKATRLGFGDPGMNYLTAHQWAWQNGANVLKQPTLDEFVLNSPEGIDAVQFQADLLNKHKVSPLPGDLVQDVVTDFNNGRVAMLDTWANFGSLKFKEFKHADVVYPARRKTRVTILHTNSLGISSKTKHPEEAWAWISQLAGKEGDLDQAKFGIGIVLRKSNLKALEEINRQDFGVDHPEVVTEVISTGRTFDITPVHSEVEQLFNAAMNDVRSGTASARDALTQAKTGIDRVLAALAGATK